MAGEQGACGSPPMLTVPKTQTKCSDAPRSLDSPGEECSGKEPWESVNFGAHRHGHCLTWRVY